MNIFDSPQIGQILPPVQKVSLYSGFSILFDFFSVNFIVLGEH